MCAGAIVLARVPRVVYAAPDPKAGAAGSVLDVLGEPRLNHRPDVAGGLLAEEARGPAARILRFTAQIADKDSVRPYSEQVLRALENRYGPLPEGVPSVAYIFEPGVEGRCLYISPSVEDVLGYPRRQWLEERGLWDRILHPDDEQRVVSNEAECARSGEKLMQEYRLRSADGRDVWIRDEMTVVFDRQTEADPLFYGVFLDVSDRKRMETELERLALYDPLTGLPNRALFADRLRQVLARRGRGSATAVYFLDLDRFKRINDSLGHAAGDDVLREVAERLNGVVRPEDTVARFGGDEFTIVCERVGGVLEAVSIADRLQRPLRQPLRAGGAELRLSASIGVALVEAGDNGDGRAPDRGRRRSHVPGQGARRRAHRAVRQRHARERRAGDADRAGAAARRSSTATCASTSSRACASAPARSWAPRRSCAGSTPSAG